MPIDTRFRDYSPSQDFLLPPSLREWLPSDHLANFISEVVDARDLSEVVDAYDNSQGGQAPFDPLLLTKLLVYACGVGVPRSRRFERSIYEVIRFRVLSANQHPDHVTISELRKRHLVALSRILLQVLELCRQAGLVKLGHVALDGTRVKVNASKQKAMSYDRMHRKADELQAEFARLLAEAEATDASEDVR
jgi:transposase